MVLALGWSGARRQGGGGVVLGARVTIKYDNFIYGALFLNTLHLHIHFLK